MINRGGAIGRKSFNAAGLGSSSSVGHGYEFESEEEEAAYESTESFAFGGTNEYLSRADAAAHDFSESMTFSVWVKVPAGAATGGIAAKGDYTLNTICFYVCRTNTDKMTVVLGRSGIGQHNKVYRTSVVVFDDTWKHFVFTWGSSTLKLYVNGTEDTNPTKTTDTAFSALYDSAVGLVVGSLWESGSSVAELVGNIDELSLWNVALSAAEVTELYNSGAPGDLSAHSQTAGLVSWYKMNSDDDLTIANGVLDSTANALHLTANNMEAGDIVAEAP